MTKRLRLWLAITAVAVLAVATTFGFITATAKSDNDGGASINYGIAPTITVEVPDGYDVNNAPNAVRDLPYKVFSASAVDVFGKEVDVITKVYAHYDSESKSLLGVDGDTFTPSSYGVFTVEYSASDAHGNIAKVLYDVECKEKDALEIVLDDSLAATSLAGVSTLVRTPMINNSIGNIDLSVIAYLTGTDVSYEIDQNTDTFIPLYAGEYKVKYVVTDYSESDVCEYVINVENNAEAMFFGDVSIPKFMILDNEYVMPELKCYHFANGLPVEVKPEVSVKVGDYKAVTLGADYKFTPSYEGRTTITYTANYNGNQIVKEYNSTCVDVNYANVSGLDMKDYFYVSEGMANLTTLSRGVQIETPQDKTKIDFINAVVSERLSVEFGILPESNFTRLNIYLYDSMDADICVKLSIYKVVGDDSQLIINDSDSDKNRTEVSFEKLATTGLSYTNNNRKISVGGSYATTIYQTLNGQRFNGFTSGCVYVSFELENVVEKSGIVIYKINNQTFSTQTSDNIEPFVVFYAYDQGIRALGDLITVKRIFVGDVLDTKCSITYYVTAPDKTNVVSIDGVTLDDDNADYTKDYTFKATQLGGYLVYMRVVDSRGNEIFYSYTINVGDKVEPEIILGVDGDLSGSVGKELKLRTATVTDDVSVNLVAQILVVLPNGVIDVLPTGTNAYLPSVAGEYEFCYYVMDEAGNVSMANYKVIVG